VNPKLVRGQHGKSEEGRLAKRGWLLLQAISPTLAILGATPKWGLLSRLGVTG